MTTDTSIATTIFDKNIHHRRSIRLQGYDYSQAGAYFVTICVQNHTCLFGEIINDAMRLNDAGRVLQAVWDRLPDHYSHVELDAWVIMPNHVHGIIILHAPVGAGFKPAPTLQPAPTAAHGLPEIVRALKTFSARRINAMRNTPGVKFWQRNYYEHIVRNEAELAHIREYIANNPTQWAVDSLHPAQVPYARIQIP